VRLRATRPLQAYRLTESVFGISNALTVPCEYASNSEAFMAGKGKDKKGGKGAVIVKKYTIEEGDRHDGVLSADVAA
jgi:hypothetical protein